MRHGRRQLARLVPTLLLVFAAAGSPALAAAPKTTLMRMEDQVMCALCKTPLSVANGPQADAERQQIRELIAAGKTERQIKDALVLQYGERVLALPRERGFNLAVYLVPIGAVAVALALLAVALPRWIRRSRASAAQPALLGPDLSSEDSRRLDEDLARYDD